MGTKMIRRALGATVLCVVFAGLPASASAGSCQASSTPLALGFQAPTACSFQQKCESVYGCYYSNSGLQLAVYFTKNQGGSVKAGMTTSYYNLQGEASPVNTTSCTAFAAPPGGYAYCSSGGVFFASRGTYRVTCRAPVLPIPKQWVNFTVACRLV